MITVVVQGGLGNQLFQYAYGKALMMKGKDVVFDISFFKEANKYTKRYYRLDKFNLSLSLPTTFEHKRASLFSRLLSKFDVDRRVRYVPVAKSADNYIADGYYTTEKYFKQIREELLHEIALIEKSDSYKKWEERISHSKKSLIVHARRADFLLTSGFVILDQTYYENALSHFDDDCEIFAFSDDIAWLKGILKRPVTQVSGTGLEDYEELMLMSLGTNFIIANSTFSWWGAWLSTGPNKRVIAPKKWFRPLSWWRADRDMVPASWVRI